MYEICHISMCPADIKDNNLLLELNAITHILPPSREALIKPASISIPLILLFLCVLCVLCGERF